MDQSREGEPEWTAGNAPRAHPIASGSTSQTVTEIAVAGAPWLQTPRLALDPGLIAIIGARGSGKTALAELIAAGCDAVPSAVNTRSFLYRARTFLKDAAVTLKWGADQTVTRNVSEVGVGARADDERPRGPRARYLSQQFVEELCASDGITSGLVREIERIVFESHDVGDRHGAVDFQELLAVRAARPREARAREEAALGVIAERIAVEEQKRSQVAVLKAQIAEKAALLARLAEARDKLAAPGSGDRIARLTSLTHAAERVRSFVRFFDLQEQQLLALKDEVESFRTRTAPDALRVLQRKYAGTGIKGDLWTAFALDYAGPVERILDGQIARAQRSSASWRGRPLPDPAPDTALIHPMMDLEKVPLSVLEAEIARLSRLVSLDRETSERFAALSRRIVAETDLLAQLKERFEDAEGAGARGAQLEAERGAASVRLFEAILAEQQVFGDLYAPIAARLHTAGGSLRKLSFSVKRTADLAAWIARGEGLLDLRRPGPFAAPGALARAAAPLKDAWETGGAEIAAAAMTAFRETHLDALRAHAPVGDSASVDYRAWMQRLNAWLTGAAHIAVCYTIAYDGIDIRHLSPGTRGIVLLLLYLGFDQDDDRPLIIDQPEENLDPKSVYDELVGLFVQAKRRRQVILVTHNANLVVNTEADQVIVAAIGSNPGHGLPPITYRTGGLDAAEVRKMVCDILEGGEAAFRERARRLGLG
ncbi:MAG: TrlF family AAA-like ATPase [Rhodospirillaceae bacterium]